MFCILHDNSIEFKRLQTPEDTLLVEKLYNSFQVAKEGQHFLPIWKFLEINYVAHRRELDVDITSWVCEQPQIEFQCHFFSIGNNFYPFPHFFTNFQQDVEATEKTPFIKRNSVIMASCAKYLQDSGVLFDIKCDAFICTASLNLNEFSSITDIETNDDGTLVQSVQHCNSQFFPDKRFSLEKMLEYCTIICISLQKLHLPTYILLQICDSAFLERMYTWKYDSFENYSAALLKAIETRFHKEKVAKITEMTNKFNKM